MCLLVLNKASLWEVMFQLQPIHDAPHVCSPKMMSLSSNFFPLYGLGCLPDPWSPSFNSRILILRLTQILSCSMRRANLKVRRQTGLSGPQLSKGRAASWWQVTANGEMLSAPPWVSRMFVLLLIYYGEISRKFHTHFNLNISITDIHLRGHQGKNKDKLG